MKLLHILTTLIVMITPLSLCAKQSVIYPRPSSEADIREQYVFALLELSLKLTKTDFGEYELTKSNVHIPPSRYPSLVRDGDVLNILSSPSTESLEQSMIGIQVPLLRGIQGIRLMMIHNDTPDLFKSLSGIKELKRRVYGQGVGWVDTLILRDAGFNILTASKYGSLFAMLERKRIDAFPRGVNEIFKEIDAFGSEFANANVDDHIVIYYPLPVHFYVAKQNDKLAQRVETGLKRALASGEFSQLFEQSFSEDIASASLNTRTWYVLTNQYVSENTAPDYVNFLHPAIRENVRFNGQHVKQKSR